jgi:hypothetical protein
MVDGGFVAWSVIGASAIALGCAAAGLTRRLVFRGPRRLIESGIQHLTENNTGAAARDFALARHRAIARGDLGATAAAWRGLAEVRAQNGDAGGAAAALAAADDAERQARHQSYD